MQKILLCLLASCALGHKKDPTAVVVEAPVKSPTVVNSAPQPKDYSQEIYAISALIAVTGFMLFYGKSQNKTLVEKFHKAAREEIDLQFTFSGFEKERGLLFETSYSEWTYYASGRQNCHYALFRYEMNRRHCLFSRVIMETVLPPPGDTLVVDVPLDFTPIHCEFYMA